MANILQHMGKIRHSCKSKQMKHSTIFQLVFIFTACSMHSAGCAGGPSMVGIAHPEPMPASGGEFTWGLNGGVDVEYERYSNGAGGGDALFLGGTGFSYARRVGDVGLAASIWGEAFVLAVGGHLELAVPIGTKESSESLPTKESPNIRRKFILCSLGTTWADDFIRPQAGIGFLTSPATGKPGVFFGGRLHGGMFYNFRDPNYGFAGSIEAGVGYRFTPIKGNTSSVQIAPFLDLTELGEGDDPTLFSFGIIVLLTVGFPTA
jgi:hypothetical protein